MGIQENKRVTNIINVKKREKKTLNLDICDPGSKVVGVVPVPAHATVVVVMQVPLQAHKLTFYLAVFRNRIF